MTDPLGNTTTYTYDDQGQQATESLSGDTLIPALTRTTVYDEYGNVTSQTEAWGSIERTTTHAYDALDREVTVTDPAGVETTTDYDFAGNVISTTSGGVTTTSVFDGLGHATEVSVDTSTTFQDFDARGLDVETVDATSVTATAAYDLGGRMVSEILESDAGNLETSYTLDLLGRETSSTTPEGTTTTTVYDRVGRVISTTVEGATTSYSYDRGAKQFSTTNPDGTVTTIQYDALNRSTVVVANDVANPSLPTEDVATTTYYDAAGNGVAFTDASGISSRSIYNVRGLVSETIANCTDTGTTPTNDPPNCTGAGTHDSMTNVVSTVEFDELQERRPSLSGPRAPEPGRRSSAPTTRPVACRR